MNLLRIKEYKNVSCPVCNEQRMARKDSLKKSSGTCGSCQSKLNSKKNRPNRKTGKYENCLNCNQSFWLYRHLFDQKKYCSKSCADAAKTTYQKEIRSCKSCNGFFLFSMKPNSNSSGNYCSLSCRNKGYLREGFKKNRSGWKRIRNEFIKNGNDFCSNCAIPDKIQVHHLIPYRISKNNHDMNLVSLCAKCHSKIEHLTWKIEQRHREKMEDYIAIIAAQLEEKWHIIKGNQIANQVC